MYDVIASAMFVGSLGVLGYALWMITHKRKWHSSNPADKKVLDEASNQLIHEVVRFHNTVSTEKHIDSFRKLIDKMSNKR